MASNLRSSVRSTGLLLCLLVGGAWLTGCGENPASSSLVGAGERVRGVAYGRPVPLRQYSQYGAVLGLQVGPGLCTATHLTGKFILTAWHCIGMPIQRNENKNVALTVVSPKGPTMIELGPDDYTTHYPETEKFEELGAGDGTKIKVPQPDLAIIEVKDKDKSETLAALPEAELPAETLKVDELNVRIAGYGKDSLDAPPQTGRLNSAPAKVEKLEDLFYKLSWELDGNFGAALPGDSGGPLHKWNNGKIAVYGVLSSGGILTAGIEEGVVFPTTHMNNYVRLDRKVVRDWVLKTIKK